MFPAPLNTLLWECESWNLMEKNIMMEFLPKFTHKENIENQVGASQGKQNHE